MDAAAKISILLEEYRSLRSEIIQRNTIFNSILTVSGTITAGTLGLVFQGGMNGKYVYGGAFVVGIVCLLLFLAYLLADHDTQAASLRIREIEIYIERSAGEPLIRWDRNRSNPIDGYGVRANSLLNYIKRRFGIGQAATS